MSGEQIRLLVIEDVPQVASHIRSLLAAQSQIKVLDVVAQGERAGAAVSTGPAWKKLWAVPSTTKW